MARIRSIKQDFFLDEELAECDMAARILFEGLWVIADKAGRLSDRPQRIKPQILPYDDVDIDALLAQLADRNFIIRYEVEGRRYIQIRNFLRHQKPHPKEPESIIPSPDAVEKNDQPWKKIESREEEDCTETITDTSSRRNGSGNGSGSGNGDLGSLDLGMGSGGSAKAGASAESESEASRDHQSFAIWDLAVGTLMSKGMSEASARSFMGLQCKNYGAEAVADAVTKTLAHAPVDPRGYLVRLLLDSQKPPPGRPSKVDVSMGNVGKVLAEKEAQRNAAAS
jgi:hypothetical protein